MKTNWSRFILPGHLLSLNIYIARVAGEVHVLPPQSHARQTWRFCSPLCVGLVPEPPPWAAGSSDGITDTGPLGDAASDLVSRPPALSLRVPEPAALGAGSADTVAVEEVGLTGLCGGRGGPQPVASSLPSLH